MQRMAIIEEATGLVRNIIVLEAGAAFDPGPGLALRAAQDGDTIAPAGTLDEVKAALREALSGRRRAAEAAFMWNGRAVNSDERTQARLTGALTGLSLLPAGASLDWVFPDGGAEAMTLATLRAFGLGVMAHVQACMARQAALNAEIEAAATQDALAALDLNAGWPG